MLIIFEMMWHFGLKKTLLEVTLLISSGLDGCVVLLNRKDVLLLSLRCIWVQLPNNLFGLLLPVAIWWGFAAQSFCWSFGCHLFDATGRQRFSAVHFDRAFSDIDSYCLWVSPQISSTSSWRATAWRYCSISLSSSVCILYFHLPACWQRTS